MKSALLSKDQRMSIFIWIALAASYLTYKEIAAFYYPTSTITFEYETQTDSSGDSISVPAGKNNNYAELKPVEINSADSSDLLQLKIPGYLISKILFYREQLGGYSSSFQLLEIYHFPEYVFERIHSLIQVNTALIQPIGINSKTEEELALHPYLSYKEAKAIVLFRKNNNQIKNQEEFDKINAVLTETKERLKPYLAKDFQSYANTTGKSP
jgi:DNA uptake protein ComE-like DNA-binding protein